MLQSPRFSIIWTYPLLSREVPESVVCNTKQYGCLKLDHLMQIEGKQLPVKTKMGILKTTQPILFWLICEWNIKLHVRQSPRKCREDEEEEDSPGHDKCPHRVENFYFKVVFLLKPAQSHFHSSLFLNLPNSDLLNLFSL